MEALNLVVQQNVGIFVVAAALVGVIALLLALKANAGAASVNTRFNWVAGEDAGSADTLSTLLRAVEANSRDIANVSKRLGELVTESQTHFKHIGLVRYDAFDGVAGQQSYSLCILDDHRNGILISSLVGTNFSRGYAIEITEGNAARKLGDEEANALSVAIGGRAA